MTNADATSILLHQYDSSPFSEKVRLALGIKGLPWCAVDQPVIMPKPDLVCLTGGYRRIPVLQIGADLYCDSQLILRELERRFPDRPLVRGHDRGLGFALGAWSDRIVFGSAVTVIFGGIGDQVPEAFRKDREALSGRPFDPAILAAAAPYAAEQLRAHVALLEDQLADGRRFLLGDEPGLADVEAEYNLWFVGNAYPPGLEVLAELDHVVSWRERMRDIGHGERSELEAEDAVEIARQATPESGRGVAPGEPNGLAVGDAVAVSADDYGKDPVTGTVVTADAHEIAIARHDERALDVVVHFPRAGYVVARA